MRSGTRAAAVIGTLALASAGLAACGQQGGSHPGAGRPQGGSAGAGRVVLAAYTATTHVKTAAFRLDQTIRANGFSGSSQSATITGHGQADLATRAFTASLNIPGGGAIKMVQVHGTEYVRLPAVARGQVPGSKPWVSLNLNKVSRAKLGASFSQLTSTENDNPAQALAQLAAVSSGVSKIGGATVAGVRTTEYRAQVNLDKVAARAQAKEGPTAAQAIRQEIRALGTAALPVDVWVDAHHLVRQIRYQVRVPAASYGGTGGGVKAVMTITFTKFGGPVRISPPPASQTTDITSEVLQHAGR